jgi:hypothetical protein
MARNADWRRYRELIERLVAQHDVALALKATGNWRALAAHRRRLVEALGPLQEAVNLVEGSTNHHHRGGEDGELNGKPDEQRTTGPQSEPGDASADRGREGQRERRASGDRGGQADGGHYGPSSDQPVAWIAGALAQRGELAHVMARARMARIWSRHDEVEKETQRWQRKRSCW